MELEEKDGPTCQTTDESQQPNHGNRPRQPCLATCVDCNRLCDFWTPHEGMHMCTTCDRWWSDDGNWMQIDKPCHGGGHTCGDHLSYLTPEANATSVAVQDPTYSSDSNAEASLDAEAEKESRDVRYANFLSERVGATTEHRRQVVAICSESHAKSSPLAGNLSDSSGESYPRRYQGRTHAIGSYSNRCRKRSLSHLSPAVCRHRHHNKPPRPQTTQATPGHPRSSADSRRATMVRYSRATKGDEWRVERETTRSQGTRRAETRSAKECHKRGEAHRSSKRCHPGTFQLPTKLRRWRKE